MKLYTEADLKKVISIYSEEYKTSTDEILKELNLTPIKLPSDEDIKGYIKSIPYYGHCTSEYCEGIEDGIKWTLDKIQGGNK